MSYLFIVACNNIAGYDLVQCRLAGKDGVEVTLDRRFRDRRRRDVATPTDRRQGERRRPDGDASLRELGWMLIATERSR